MATGADISRAVIHDPAAVGVCIGLMVPGSYLDFADAVPFTDAAGLVFERGVLNEVGRITGRAQAAVRALAPADFNRIVAAGLAERSPLLPRDGAPIKPVLREEPMPFVFDTVRERVLVSRAVRNRVFRQIVLRAYDERCAVTGLKLINGGGRAEVEAAHIRGAHELAQAVRPERSRGTLHSVSRLRSTRTGLGDAGFSHMTHSIAG